MAPLPDMNAYAKKFGKPDMERLGFFIEMPYLPARGKPGKQDKVKKEALRTMLPGGPKTKCGNMDGYFGDEFGRIFKGEGHGRPPRLGGKKQEGGLPFMPTGPAKIHSTPGDYFGCFHIHTAFSPKERPVPRYKTPPPNCLTNPPRKGGPGYINITIAKYPEYKGGRPRKEPKPKPFRAGPMITCHFPKPFFYPNPYVDPLKDPPSKRLYIKPKDTVTLDKNLAGRPIFMPNGPAKWDGGCKGGTFEKWPDWVKDRWLSPLEKEKKLAGKPLPFVRGEFYPQSRACKTTNIYTSLYNTDYSMNATNWKTYEPTYVKRLLKTIY